MKSDKHLKGTRNSSTKVTKYRNTFFRSFNFFFIEQKSGWGGNKVMKYDLAKFYDSIKLSLLALLSSKY